MKKIHLKRKNRLYKMKPINIIAIFIVITLLCLYLFFGYIKNRFMPSLFEYWSLEAKKFSSIIINDAIDKYITDKIEVEN